MVIPTLPVVGTRNKHAERRKHTTYQTRDGGGARLTNLPLVPVAVNVFGGVGEEAATYFNSVELVAKQRKRPYRPAPGGPRTLTELTALLTILTAADIVVASHSRRRAVGEQDPPALLTCDTYLRQIAHRGGVADHVP